MTYVVTKPDGRHELRQSSATPKGPRSRTLVSFRELTPEVVERARARASGTLTDEDLLRATRRAGLEPPMKRPDRLAAELLSAIDSAEPPSPDLRRLLTDALNHAGPVAERPVTDEERAAAAWLGRSLERRGEALWDLLLLSDSLPARPRGDNPTYPPLRTGGS